MNPPTNDATVPEAAQRVRGTVHSVVGLPVEVLFRRAGRSKEEHRARFCLATDEENFDAIFFHALNTNSDIIKIEPIKANASGHRQVPAKGDHE